MEVEAVQVGLCYHRSFIYIFFSFRQGPRKYPPHLVEVEAVQVGLCYHRSFIYI